ncbi:MAG: NAD(P)/FAD-dependent oxidoreductase [Methanotrichaceae archaeon]|nr:NAD(P)/FAD-dependent oxidoreductase [Methanotrichaceae archaeon]
MKCEVLVVGASSAGIMAAIASARCDAKVVLIDKGLGNMSHPANTIFQGMALHAGLFLEKSYIINKLEGMRIISPGCHAITIPSIGYFLDRKRFDDFYLQRARSEGVSLLRLEAKDLKSLGRKKCVITGQDEIEADVVIDASGIRPALAWKNGLSPMLHPEDIAWAMEATVELHGLGEERFFEYYVGSIAPGWKATFSPGGNDRATLGVFVRGHQQEIHGFFQRFLSLFKRIKSKCHENVDDLKIISLAYGGDPIAALPGQIVSDGFMVTGGAAGQSGLAYSMRAGTICGQIAGEAIRAGDVSANFLNRYETTWRSEFYWEYRMGRAALLTLMGMKDEEIDRLARSLSGKNLFSRGSLFKKTFCTGTNLALVKPKILFDLVRSLARG